MKAFGHFVIKIAVPNDIELQSEDPPYTNHLTRDLGYIMWLICVDVTILT